MVLVSMRNLARVLCQLYRMLKTFSPEVTGCQVHILERHGRRSLHCSWLPQRRVGISVVQKNRSTAGMEAGPRQRDLERRTKERYLAGLISCSRFMSQLLSIN